MLYYLDTNIIIYAIENHPKYGSKCIQILENIQNGKTQVSCSILILVELLNVLNKLNKISKKGRIDIKKSIDAILSLPIKWIELNPTVIRRASEYTYNINAIDYIHIASMELNGIKKIISADKELDRVPIVQREDPLG